MLQEDLTVKSCQIYLSAPCGGYLSLTFSNSGQFLETLLTGTMELFLTMQLGRIAVAFKLWRLERCLQPFVFVFSCVFVFDCVFVLIFVTFKLMLWWLARCLQSSVFVAAVVYSIRICICLCIFTCICWCWCYDGWMRISICLCILLVFVTFKLMLWWLAREWGRGLHPFVFRSWGSEASTWRSQTQIKI